MTRAAARRLAALLHGDGLDRYGQPLLDHVRRVAAAVPLDARVVGWLHEVLECTATSAQELRALGVSEDEIRAVELLTRDLEAGADAYAAHIARIAEAPDRAGRLARVVKRADLRDRLLHQPTSGASGVIRPPYGDALARLSAAPTGGDADASQGSMSAATVGR